MNKPLVCRGHTRPIPGLSFSPLEPDGQHFLMVSSCKDGTPMLRDGQTGDWMGSFVGHKGCCWAIRLSANSHRQRAITGSADFSAKVWDANTGTCLLTLPHDHIVRCVDLNAEGTRAVTGGHEKKLKFWDVEALLATLQQDNAASDSNAAEEAPQKTVTEATTVKSDACTLIKQSETSQLAHDGVVKSVIWDSANNQIISAGEDKAVKFWNVDTLELKETIQVTAAITSMERNHDIEGTISLTYGNTVDFIDPKSRKVTLSHALDYPPSTASIHPTNGERFVTGSVSDGWVRVHDAATGQELQVHKGHHGPVHAVSFSPDGELYASGSEDGTIRLWQTTPNKSYGLWIYDGPAVNGGAVQ